MTRLNGISRALVLASLLFAASAPATAQQLRMDLDGDHVRIENGTPGARVGILLGFDQADYQLPGPAHIRLETLVILDFGVLDGDGRAMIPWTYEGDPIEPISFYAQAISVDQRGAFSTSELFRMKFDGVRHVHGEVVASLLLDTMPTGLPALRARRLVA